MFNFKMNFDESSTVTFGVVHLQLKMTFWKCRLHPGHLKFDIPIWGRDIVIILTIGFIKAVYIYKYIYMCVLYLDICTKNPCVHHILALCLVILCFSGQGYATGRTYHSFRKLRTIVHAVPA